MDAFFAAVEQLDRPELRGEPVIIGTNERRGVVSTASYEARAFGVRSAMPSVEAARRCPEAVWVRPRMARYVEVSKIVREVFDRFTPLVEPLSLDEAFLDVSGSRLLFGDGESIARRLRAEVEEATGGLTVSVGVASTKYVAKVASDLDKPDGLTVVPPGAEREFLAPLPVHRLWGVGKVGRAKLASIGVATIGDIQTLGEERLRPLVGASAAAHWSALAIGDDPRRVETDTREKTIGHERTFSEDLTDRETCESVLLSLAEGVGKRLRKHGVRARTVRLKLRLSPFDTTTRQHRLSDPSDDDLVLYEVARRLLANHWNGRGVRLLGITGADLVAGGGPRQRGLFDPVEPERGGGERSELNAAVDALRARYGDAILRRGRKNGGIDGASRGP